MDDQKELTETELRATVDDAIARASRSLVSTIIWTVLAIFAFLVGAQSIQFGVAGSGLGAAGLIGLGGFVSLCSLYLLYSLHWSDS
jgi:hypothetical protein